MSQSELRARAESFRRLHEMRELVVLPGVWDLASARIFAAEGYPALGTSSTGICWSVGRSGGWPVFLEASARIVRAVSVPVSLDIEAGFADEPAELRQHVQGVIEVGACGINLEDGLVEGVLADAAVLESKIQAVRELAHELEHPLFINARTDVYLGGPNDLAETVRRGRLYAAAGADGFFAPGVTDAALIATLVKEVPLPLNIYAGPGVPAVAQLAELGVRRLSVGCGPMQALLAQTQGIARSLRKGGRYGSFVDNWMPYADAEALCSDSEVPWQVETR